MKERNTIEDRQMYELLSNIHDFSSHEEIPYAVEVLTEQFLETANIIRIRSVIVVERNSQKGIVVGSKGSAIKHVGLEARKTSKPFLTRKFILNCL